MRTPKKTRWWSTLLVLLVTAPPSSASAEQGAKRSGEGAQADVVVMFRPWRDPVEGAFTLNVPQGWEITGGTSRRTNVNVRHHVRAVSPGGGIQILIGDASLVPNQVPNQMTAMAGFREGQTMQAAWGGEIRLARYATGEQYAQGYGASRLCRSQRASKVRHLEQASRDLAARAAGYGRAIGAAVRASVGETTFQCGEQVAYVRAATLLAGPPQGAGAFVWDVLELSGYTTSDASAEVLARYVLNSMVASFRLDPQWEAAQARALRDTTGAVTRSQQQMAASLADRAREQARASQVDVMSGWVSRNKRMDAAMQRGSDARRGTTTVEDPVLGSRTVRNDSSYYWTRPDGSIVGTNTDTPPDYSSGWRMMKTR